MLRMMLLAVVVVVVLLGVVVGVLIAPYPVPVLAAPATVQPDFRVARHLALAEAGDPPVEVNPVCLATVLDHGYRTPRVVVLLHGLSNCPAQYRELAARLHVMGHNVLIPRMPYHGFSDRLTPDFKHLTIDGLAAWVDETLAIAAGLGDEIVVAGLSVSGVTAAWLAAERTDVARAVVIAPFFAPPGISVGTAALIGRALARLPNVFMWWNSELKENNPGPAYADPRFPTRVLAQFMVLGGSVLERASAKPPACKHLAVVTSASDDAINLSIAGDLAKRWRAWPGVMVTEYEFPREAKVPHDLIDPNQPDAVIETSYPPLLELLGGTPP